MAGAKVTKPTKSPDRIVERNVALIGDLMQYLLANPKIIGLLPENFELVIFPEDDSEIRSYNLELLENYGSQGRPVVFVRMKSSHDIDFEKGQPELYVPLAA